MLLPSLSRTVRRSLLNAGLFFLAATGPTLLAQTSSAHDGFNPSVTGQVDAVAAQPNGQVVIGGLFSSLQPNGAAAPVTRANVARLNADGSLDTHFDPKANGEVQTVLVQPNGQIVIGGLFTSVSPNGGAAVTRNYLARFNADGSLDTSFNPNPSGPTVGEVTALAWEPATGQILVGGTFSAMSPNGGSAISIGRLARLNLNGTVDTSFAPTPNAQVDAIVVQPNGQILVGGGFISMQPNGATTATLIGYLARLNSDGTLDSTFNPEPNNKVASIALQTDGQIIIGGYFTSLNPDTSSSFVPAAATANLAQPQDVITSVTITASGQGYVAVPTVTFTGSQTVGGTTATGVAVLVGGALSSITITNQGTGYTSAPNITITPPNPVGYIARLHPDGSADTTFLATAAAGVNAVAVQPDGKILVGGTIGDLTYNGVSTFVANYLVRLNSDGTPDSNFTPAPNYIVNAIVVQSDGEILIGGEFTQVKGANASSSLSRDGLARIQPTGTVDSDFNPNALGAIGAVAVQANGQVLVGGSFSSIGGVTVSNLARLNTDGSVDTTFAPSPNGLVTSIAIQSNGMIVFGGAFTYVGATPLDYIARVNPNGGAVDTTFNPSANGQINAIAITTKTGSTNVEQILIGGLFSFLNFTYPTAISVQNMARLNLDGSVDTTFEPNPSAPVYAIIYEPSDDAAIIAGAFTDVTPASDTITSAVNYIARLDLTNGQLDTGFNPNPNGAVYSLALQPNGQILLGGAFSTLQPNPTLTTYINGVAVVVPVSSVPTVVGTNPGASQQQTVLPNGQTETTTTTPVVQRKGLARVNAADGSLDQNFDPEADGVVLSIGVDPNNTLIIAGGTFKNIVGTSRPYIARMNSAGQLDTFNPGLNYFVDAVVALPNDKFYAAGAFTTIQPPGTTATATLNHIARFNGDGSVDAAFTAGATTTGVGTQPNSYFKALAVQSNGTFLVGGAFVNLAGLYATNIARFLADGSQDTSFYANASGPVNAIAVVQDTTYFVGGAFNAIGGGLANNFAHLNPDSTLDLTFSNFPDGPVNAISAQVNQPVVIGGAFAHLGATAVANLARESYQGVVDTSFHPNPNGAVTLISAQPNGQLLIAGSFTTVAGVARAGLARVNADGSLDATFNPAPTGAIDAMVLQPDGKIVVGGAFTGIAGSGQAYLARLNSNGSLDTTFNPAPNGVVYTLVLRDLPAGSTGAPEIMVGGAFTSIAATGPAYLALLYTGGTFDPTFTPNPNGAVSALAIGQDGKTIVGGSFSLIGGQARSGLASLGSVYGSTETIGVSPDLSTITWTLTGAPTLNSVLIETSPDAASWVTLGYATRTGIADTWQLANVSGLPSGQNFFILAVGLTASGQGSSQGMIQSVQEFYINQTGAGGAAAVPGLSSARSVSAVTGNPFYYQIASNGSPYSYSAVGLPAGLTINSTTGVISGTATQPGTYTVTLSFADAVTVAQSVGSTSAGVGVTTVPIVITVAPPSRLLNLSALDGVTASQALSNGFVIGGSAPKTVLLRAVGPGLGAFGVASPLAYPVLQLTDSTGAVILSNHGWDGSSTLMKIFAEVGAFPLSPGSFDCALVTTLAPGSYSLQVSSGDGSSGSALAEIYDADSAPLNLPQRLVDLATLGTVGSANTLSGGFVVSGTAPKRLLIRADGPALSAYGVASPLAQPLLNVYDSHGTLLAMNAGWGAPSTVNSAQPASSPSSVAAAAASAGAFALGSGSADSAVVVTLPPGAYSATVTPAVAGQSGTALVEIYELP